MSAPKMGCWSQQQLVWDHELKILDLLIPNNTTCSSSRDQQQCNEMLFVMPPFSPVSIWELSIIHEKRGKNVLTICPSVASPSNPPKVITGDMQAQYRKRKEAKHCKLIASLKSLQYQGAFRFTSKIKPPKILQQKDGGWGGVIAD